MLVLIPLNLESVQTHLFVFRTFIIVSRFYDIIHLMYAVCNQPFVYFLNFNLFLTFRFLCSVKPGERFQISLFTIDWHNNVDASNHIP